MIMRYKTGTVRFTLIISDKKTIKPKHYSRQEIERYINSEIWDVNSEL